MGVGEYVFLFLLGVLELVSSQYECIGNEVFTPNINPCNTCEERGWCPQQEAGCDCSPGYFRNNQGICVPPEACDLPDPGNINFRRGAYRCQVPYEEYRECGSACPPSCQRPTGTRPCPELCVPGCFCISGFVKNRLGTCVKPEQCFPPLSPPPACGRNEEYTECGSACPPTCQDRQPGSCTLECVKGCFCKRGFLRRIGRCVRPRDCGIGYPVAPAPPTFVPPPPVYGTRQPPVVTIDPLPGINVTATPNPNSRGCPNRKLCNRFCQSTGKSIGFCIGERFTRCSCSP